MPDLVLAGTWKPDGTYIRHLRIAGTLRDLQAEDSTGATASTLGWAIAGSGKIGLPFIREKDNFKFAVQYGEGYGAQIKSGPNDAAFNPVDSELETIGVFSTYGGFQHWWTDSLRSNFVYGYVDAKNPEFITGDELKNTTYAAADLIWNPYKMVTLGFEYLWGSLENKDGNTGTSNRYLLSSRIAF